MSRQYHQLGSLPLQSLTLYPSSNSPVLAHLHFRARERNPKEILHNEASLKKRNQHQSKRRPNREIENNSHPIYTRQDRWDLEFTLIPDRQIKARDGEVNILHWDSSYYRSSGYTRLNRGILFHCMCWKSSCTSSTHISRTLLKASINLKCSNLTCDLHVILLLLFNH